MSFPPVRFGLVGYGSGGRYFHAPLLRSAPGVELLGVVTSSPDRQAQIAADLPGCASFPDLAALARAGAEAVSISTPAATHMPLAREALRLGLAVVGDKPFALDATSAKETVALAAELGLVLSAYQNRRWDSDFRTVQRLLEEGSLGEITRFESRFERWRPAGGPGPAGGGALLDLGSHLVDQALLLLGPVVRVYADLHLQADGLDDDVLVSLAHRGGAHSQLWASWRQGAPGPRFRVTGTRATYVIGGLDGQEAALLAGGSPATLGDAWGIESEPTWGRLFRGDQGEPVPSARGAWDTYYPAFAAAVRGDGPVPVDPRDAVAVVQVLDAARQSALTGQVVAPA